MVIIDKEEIEFVKLMVDEAHAKGLNEAFGVMMLVFDSLKVTASTRVHLEGIIKDSTELLTKRNKEGFAKAMDVIMALGKVDIRTVGSA
jgi:hypothetical protein